jgi:hypothetical protein
MGKYSVFYLEFGINPSFEYVCLLLCRIYVKIYNCLANYGVVLLLCVESLMAGSTTGVPMSFWYGGYQTATPLPYYPKATYATTSYCTEVFKNYTFKAPEFSSATYAAPSHYTDALKCYSAPNYYTTKATEDDYACCPILRGS